MVATLKHETHRLRRGSITAFFSTASIGRVEPILKDKLERLLRRWSQLRDGEILEMLSVFQAYASDNVTTYAFGDCFNFINDESWGAEYFHSQEKYFKLTHIFGTFPMIMRLINSLPVWLMSMFIPNLSSMTEKQNVSLAFGGYRESLLPHSYVTNSVWQWRVNRVREIRNSPDPDAIRNTIFEGILSSNLPAEEKTDTRMAQDAQLIALAGESTTGELLLLTITRVGQKLTLDNA